ncbi:MAG: Ig-like domain-containing protein, partial [Halobacteriovoraceae bacterium]|nr:Ig-like domain-containing protein [Halobacteriovoraceae bacterium]
MFKRLLALCFFIISFAVLANSAPTINLGADQFVLAGGNISLNASVNDPDGDELSVLWKVVFSPSGSKKELSQYTGVTTDLTLDRVGTFIIEATVSDGVTEVSDSVVILSSQTVGDLVFGPTNYFANPKCLGSSSRKDCIDSTDNFNISFPGNNYTLIARNNGYVSVSLGLNSNPITSFYDFSGGEEIFSKNVSLLSSNVLLSKIGGNPSASIEIEIRENVLPPDNNSKPILTVGNIEYFGNSGGEVSYSISDTDISDSHEIKILRQPNNGTIEVDGNVLNFIPRVNNQGDASALVALIDNGSPAKVDLKEITISFNSGNRPPEVNGNLPLSEGEVVSFTPEIIDNIGDSHQIAIKNQPVGGFASINGKAITFTPDGVYEGPINFEITVTDSGTPALSTDYIVTGQVNNNLPPLITGISSYSIPQTNSLNGSVSGSDPSINQVTNFYIANDPTNGELTLDSNGNFQYRPDFDFSGTDSFIIGISDNAVNPLNNQIEIQVNVVENFIPFSPSSPINVNINSGQSLSQNIVFIDENSLQNHTLEIVKEPIGGSVSLSGPLLTYNSDLSFSGEDEVVVGITDNGVPSKTGLVVLKFNVTGNNAPVPTVRWGLGSNQLASGITSNFTIIPNDPDSGQSHLYQITRDPLGGVIIPGGFWGNRFSYVPNEGFSGPDSFEVTVIDSGIPSLQSIIEVPLNVTINSPPNPTDYSLEVLAGLNTGVTINANDIDRGQLHVLEILSQPVQSQATVVGNSIRIDAESTATGSETIQIRVTDNGTPAQSDDFNLTITYKTNAQPIFNNDELSYSGVELNSIFVSANYVDPDEIQGQAMNYEILNQPTNGSVDRFSIGRGRLSFRYMPNSGFVGNDSLVIRIFDNGTPSLSDLITVNFSVIQNSPPQPFASSQDILQGYSSAQITVFDGDPDENQRHEFGIFAQPAGGTTFIDERFGRLTYTPQSEFFGTDQIGVIVTERVNGIPALSGTTVVSIFVEENLPPTLSIDGIQSTFQSTPLSGNVELNDPNQRPTDSRFNGLYNWEILNNPTNGSVTIGQGGFYTYTPSLG